MVEIAVLDTAPAILGECPVWSAGEQVLYWEDIDGRAIHRHDPVAGTFEKRELPGRPGSFVLTQTTGRLLVAMEQELVWFDWDSGKTSPFMALEDPIEGLRLNDGRCDPSGRFVVGTMWAVSGERLSRGSLYSIGADGAPEVLETDVGIPNGLVFDADRSLMYWADTYRQTIWVWDYDTATAERSNKRVFFDYNAHDDIDGVPDGGCLDSEGFYWSASVSGWAVTRIAPDGTVDRHIELPVHMPTMPAFGGPDLSTLYVTSLTGGVAEKDGVRAGSTLAIDVGVSGLLEVPFAL